ncbi:MAG TPA: hypothetical protein VF777_08650 [Phycisphaerales bacterium]
MATRAALSLFTLAGLAAVGGMASRPAAHVPQGTEPQVPVSMCLAEGTVLTPELKSKLHAVNQAIAAYLEVDPNDPFQDRYFLGSRWSG